LRVSDNKAMRINNRKKITKVPIAKDIQVEKICGLTSMYSGIKHCKQRWATWLPFIFFIKVTIPGFNAETTMENCSGVLRVSITF